jgi:hypothetical protein
VLLVVPVFDCVIGVVLGTGRRFLRVHRPLLFALRPSMLFGVRW